MRRRTLLSQLLFSAAAAQVGAAQSSRPKPATPHTLVCIFLRGGADTRNILIPHADESYYQLRPTIAIAPPPEEAFHIDAGRAIRLDDSWALHPAMAPLLPAWQEGRLAAVEGVGLGNPSGSHFECESQLERGAGLGQTVAGGWLGRHLQSRPGGQPSPLSAISIAPNIAASLRGAPSASAFQKIDQIRLAPPGTSPSRAKEVLQALYAAEVGLVGDHGPEIVDLARRVEALAANAPEADSMFPDDPFAQGLAQVAQLVRAEVGLEVACLDLGGWDTHFLQGAAEGQQARRVAQLAAGLAAFDKAIASHSTKVTSLVLTEFGRRPYENSAAGTDHGRGFTLFALGAQLHGGQVHQRAGQASAFPDPPTLPIIGDLALPIVGPAGSPESIDIREVLAEILAGPLGNPHTDKVFPDFVPTPLGLFRS